MSQQPTNDLLELALEAAMRAGTEQRKQLAHYRGLRTTWGPNPADHALRRRIDAFLGNYQALGS